MQTSSPVRYRRSTEMAAEDMISEGAPLSQPSRADSCTAQMRARLHRLSNSWDDVITPTSAFWIGFASGLVALLLER
ncbi:MAG TPA: hypothetical protein VGE29_07935, partial [Prosthecobacter sp.]